MCPGLAWNNGTCPKQLLPFHSKPIRSYVRNTRSVLQLSNITSGYPEAKIHTRRQRSSRFRLVNTEGLGRSCNVPRVSNIMTVSFLLQERHGAHLSYHAVPLITVDVHSLKVQARPSPTISAGGCVVSASHLFLLSCRTTDSGAGIARVK